MTITSYAQNFEDVILWRALGHIPNGTYVDVGAQHPVVDSVSKAFYEHGWRGVHIEPVPAYAALLREDRPDETVLQLALSDRPGVLDLNVIAGTGLSTGVEAYASTHSSEHGFAAKVVKVPMLPMSAALASLNGQQVHWLKIDVEGLEEQVLLGWDSKVLRPWVIVIEATVPLSQELSFAKADRLLVDAGYEFAYFDGLNRFYTAAEHRYLAEKLSLPPNVFDAVELSGLASNLWCKGLVERHRRAQETLTQEFAVLRMRIADLEGQLRGSMAAQEQSRALVEARSQQTDQAEARLAEMESRRAEVEARLVQEGVRAASAEAQLTLAHELHEATLNSRSWRLTAPLRLAGGFARRLRSAIREGRLSSGSKRRIKKAVRAMANTAARYPALKRAATRAVSLVPPLHRRLKAMLGGAPAATPSTTGEHEVRIEAAPLSPDASILLRQLLRGRVRAKGF